VRSNIDIDDELLREVMALIGAKTKKQAVEEALKDLIRRRKSVDAIMALRGKIEWEGDLD
jgi:Arc/MetJ family transcription regulator